MTGFSFGFYKSPKSIKLPDVEPPHFNSPVRRPVHKKRNDVINKGVGHKIKKPKLKAKDQVMFKIKLDLVIFSLLYFFN